MLQPRPKMLLNFRSLTLVFGARSSAHGIYQLGCPKRGLQLSQLATMIVWIAKLHALQISKEMESDVICVCVQLVQDPETSRCVGVCSMCKKRRGCSLENKPSETLIFLLSEVKTKKNMSTQLTPRKSMSKPKKTQKATFQNQVFLFAF